MTRFRDPRLCIDAFEDEILVRCPRCAACALVQRRDAETRGSSAPCRFSCLACGAIGDWAGQTRVRCHASEPKDPYFQYALWLQTPCCDRTFWAYNRPHLDFLEQFVQAKLREHQPDAHQGWSNQSLFSRLPPWMQSRKNREDILRAIANLRTTLPSEFS